MEHGEPNLQITPQLTDFQSPLVHCLVVGASPEDVFLHSLVLDPRVLARVGDVSINPDVAINLPMECGRVMFLLLKSPAYWHDLNLPQGACVIYLVCLAKESLEKGTLSTANIADNDNKLSTLHVQEPLPGR